MNKYDILVFVKNEDGDETIVKLPVEYDNEYNLRRDVTNIGVNGVLQKLENKYLYYPPHKIEKIEVKELK